MLTSQCNDELSVSRSAGIDRSFEGCFWEMLINVREERYILKGNPDALKIFIVSNMYDGSYLTPSVPSGL